MAGADDHQHLGPVQRQQPDGGAGQTQGYRRVALHPLGSLDDHAYVLDDAGVGSMISDVTPASSST
ncbi:hypothetical protein JHV666_48460 [Mycobacterium avium subsp. hominissuis]